MYPHIKHVESDHTLPASADVVVIGGGIVGTCTAYFLAERGVDVVLLDKSGIAHEQSSRNWGWCRTMGRDLAEIPLAIESLKLWDAWSRKLEHDTGFMRSGILYACETKAEITERAEWLRQAGPLGATARLIDRNEMTRYLGNTPPVSWRKGLLAETDGRAEPDIATAAIAEGARARGAKLFSRCSVRALGTQSGMVTSVLTERGEIRCQHVVVAAGAWSSLFCRNLGIRFPQLKVMGSVMRTAPLDGGPKGAVATSKVSFRKRADGGYTVAMRNTNIAPLVPDSFRYFNDFLPMIRNHHQEYRLRVNRHTWQELRTPTRWSNTAITPFETQRLYDPKPVDTFLDQALIILAESFPVFADAKIEQRWAGLIDVTPDIVPVIDRVETLPGLYLASGFSGHGFGIGPGAGHLMADIVTGSRPLVDPSLFRFERFA
ncbi:glycine/D-amino acid oxidase-like deaminating enzyme [Pseudomonas duriflava]|uniref:Glycine/D-amino acid oxidase-like deaminating enzyme n=1 Tax=Pseudomonas duriflava TaxID=459528 RepID=A0A562QAG2_9PSED|nr:FAD-binding oxidoreductase [Pseudomonas duriflava]TWI53713.1 glycine/D-amino acid oxidase-like deaminating enzyme [Pseudomonas duriflava]